MTKKSKKINEKLKPMKIIDKGALFKNIEVVRDRRYKNFEEFKKRALSRTPNEDYIDYIKNNLFFYAKQCVEVDKILKEMDTKSTSQERLKEIEKALEFDLSGKEFEPSEGEVSGKKANQEIINKYDAMVGIIHKIGENLTKVMKWGNKGHRIGSAANYMETVISSLKEVSDELNFLKEKEHGINSEEDYYGPDVDDLKETLEAVMNIKEGKIDTKPPQK